MSYLYRNSGNSGIDLIVATKKGIELGGMPKGAIIPIGYKFIPEVLEYLNNTKHNVYIAKHCDNKNELRYVQQTGIVNRFGWYITDTKVKSSEKNWSLNVDGHGWFKRVTVSSIEDIEKFI